MRQNTRLFTLFVSTLFASCAALNSNKKITGLRIDYDTETAINYGAIFPIEVFAVYPNGKDRKITGNDELIVDIAGAVYEDGKVIVGAYPESFGENTIRIMAKRISKSDTVMTERIIPFNYASDLTILFYGSSGARGADGDDAGYIALFRDGSSGSSGSDGANGGSGSQLELLCWRDEIDSSYKFQVKQLSTEKNYFYRYFDRGFLVVVNVNGGTGGMGGDGGDGRDGKSGTQTEKKSKDPGSGGNGGNGGNGGIGGSGGFVRVIIHPNAIEIAEKIVVYNDGGLGGTGGTGGSPGKAGTPLDGQAVASDGYTGSSGSSGIQGQSGPEIVIKIEEFDIP